MATVATGGMRFVIDAGAIDEERRRFAETLEAVGPNAPTNVDGWTAHDIAAHVASLDRFAGVPTYLGRMLVARGVRLYDLARRAPQLTQRAIDAEKRRGLGATIARLRQPSPRLLLQVSLRAVGLFEVWAHHEDVRRANGIERDDHPALDEVIAWLRRYSRIDAVPEGPPHEVTYWLAGREGGPRPV